jgi:hypothetical protein
MNTDRHALTMTMGEAHDDNGTGLHDKRVDCHAWVQARNDGGGGGDDDDGGGR